MDQIQELYRDRNKVSKDLFRRAFDGGLTDAFPFVVNKANYFVFGQEPEHLTVHAGLEVGFLTEGKPDIDAIAIGPNCWNFHSPSEMLQISSARKVYQLMCHILSAIH